MIRIGFRGMLYYTYNKERPTPSSNYKGPLYCVPSSRLASGQAVLCSLLVSGLLPPTFAQWGAHEIKFQATQTCPKSLTHLPYTLKLHATPKSYTPECREYMP